MQAKEKPTCTGIFAVIFSQKLEYIKFLNSFGIKMARFVKEKKKSSKSICGKYCERNTLKM